MLSCKKRLPSPPQGRDGSPLPPQRPVLGSQTLQLRSCFLLQAPLQHQHTQARTRVCRASDTHCGGYRALSSRPKTTKTPPRHSTPSSTFSLGNTRQTKAARSYLIHKQEPSAFRHERRWCEASTTHSHACEQASRARLRRHVSTLMRYPSYAQRTSTTLPSCGKPEFLKTQRPQRTLLTRASSPPRRQDVSPRHV